MKLILSRISRVLTVSVLCAALCLSCMATALADGPQAIAFNTPYAVSSDFVGTFTTSARGTVKLTLSGDVSYVRLYKGNNPCWTANTLYLREGNRHVFTIGLKKGRYTVMARGSGSASLSASFKKSNAFEIEPNNATKTATQLTLGAACSAVFLDTESDYVNMGEDYYKVKLKKGKKYTVKITQYKKLFNAENPLASLFVLNPNGSRLLSVDGTYQLSGSTLSKKGMITFTAKKSGWHYIALKPGWSSKTPVNYKITVK